MKATCGTFGCLSSTVLGVWSKSIEIRIYRLFISEHIPFLFCGSSLLQRCKPSQSYDCESKLGKRMILLQFVLVFIAILACVNAGTEFDNSLKPAAESSAKSRTQQSVADIVARATGKLDKTKAKQAAAKGNSAPKRKWHSVSFCLLVLT